MKPKVFVYDPVMKSSYRELSTTMDLEIDMHMTKDNGYSAIFMHNPNPEMIEEALSKSANIPIIIDVPYDNAYVQTKEWIGDRGQRIELFKYHVDAIDRLKELVK